MEDQLEFNAQFDFSDARTARDDVRALRQELDRLVETAARGSLNNNQLSGLIANLPGNRDLNVNKFRSNAPTVANRDALGRFVSAGSANSQYQRMVSDFNEADRRLREQYRRQSDWFAVGNPRGQFGPVAARSLSYATARRMADNNGPSVRTRRDFYGNEVSENAWRAEQNQINSRDRAEEREMSRFERERNQERTRADRAQAAEDRRISSLRRQGLFADLAEDRRTVRGRRMAASGAIGGVFAGLRQPAVGRNTVLGLNFLGGGTGAGSALGLGNGLLGRLVSPFGMALPGMIGGAVQGAGLGGLAGLIGGPVGMGAGMLLGALTGGLVGGITSTLKTLTSLAGAALTTAIGLAKAGLQIVGKTIKSIWDGIWDTVKGLGEGLKNVLGTLLNILSVSKLIDVGKKLWDFGMQGGSYQGSLRHWYGVSAGDMMTHRQASMNAGLGEWGLADFGQQLANEAAMFRTTGEMSGAVPKALLNIFEETFMSSAGKSSAQLVEGLADRLLNDFQRRSPAERREMAAQLSSSGYGPVVQLLEEFFRRGLTGRNVVSSVGAGAPVFTAAQERYLARTDASRNALKENLGLTTRLLGADVFNKFVNPLGGFLNRSLIGIRSGNLGGILPDALGTGAEILGNFGITGGGIREGAAGLWGGVKRWTRNFFYGENQRGSPGWSSRNRIDSPWFDLLGRGMARSKEMSAGFRSFLKDFADEFPYFWQLVKQSASTLWNGLKGDAATTWDAIKDTASKIWQEISPDVLKGWHALNGELKTLLDNLTNWLRDPDSLVDSAGGFFNALSKRWNELMITFSGPINYLKDLWFNIWDQIRDVDIRLHPLDAMSGAGPLVEFSSKRAQVFAKGLAGYREYVSDGWGSATTKDALWDALLGTNDDKREVRERTGWHYAQGGRISRTGFARLAEYMDNPEHRAYVAAVLSATSGMGIEDYADALIALDPKTSSNTISAAHAYINRLTGTGHTLLPGQERALIEGVQQGRLDITIKDDRLQVIHNGVNHDMQPRSALNLAENYGGH